MVKRLIPVNKSSEAISPRRFQPVMQSPSVFIVGQPAEVRHHVASLESRIPLRIVDADKVTQVARPGDLAIFVSEHFDRFRFACRSLKKRQVATLYLIDGILEWRNAWENRPDEPACPFAMRPVLAHKAACIGPSQARVIESWGNIGKTEVVGVPRFDGLSTRPSPVASRGTCRILVMTAKTPGFTDQQLKRVKQSLQDLKSWLDRQADETHANRSIEVIWRLTGGLDQELGVVNQLNDLTGNELATVLAKVDAVVSTPSTAMLEAMIMGIPVAALDYHNCPSYLQNAWSIRAADHIDSVMRELVSPAETKMAFQQFQLRDMVYRDTNATDRLERLVREMIRISGDQLGTCQPLKFPNQILESAQETVADSFVHEKYYPQIEEFSCTDLVELQVELSHARREIRHLNRVQSQLRHELGQAHQIFEQIQSHPIAGPIVQIRQRVLDWLAGFRAQKIPLESRLNSPSLPSACQDPHSSPLSGN